MQWCKNLINIIHKSTQFKPRSQKSWCRVLFRTEKHLFIIYPHTIRDWMLWTANKKLDVHLLFSPEDVVSMFSQKKFSFWFDDHRTVFHFDSSFKCVREDGSLSGSGSHMASSLSVQQFPRQSHACCYCSAACGNHRCPVLIFDLDSWAQKFLQTLRILSLYFLQ